jgi:hypothetical protein
MYHYFFELAFWILLAFFVGCFLGGFGRMRFGAPAPRESLPVPAPAPVVAPVFAAKIAKPKKVAAAKARPVTRARKK